MPNRIQFNSPPIDPVKLIVEFGEVFSDSSRTRIMLLLMNNAQVVGQLVSTMDLPQPTISHHLSLLKSAGVVEVIPMGKNRKYQLTAKGKHFITVIKHLL